MKAQVWRIIGTICFFVICLLPPFWLIDFYKRKPEDNKVNERIRHLLHHITLGTSRANVIDYLRSEGIEPFYKDPSVLHAGASEKTKSLIRSKNPKEFERLFIPQTLFSIHGGKGLIMESLFTVRIYYDSADSVLGFDIQKGGIGP